MREINRSLLVVRAKEPFLDWVNSLPDPADVTLEDLNNDRSAFLLPEYEEDRRKDYLLRKYFKEIFEEELNSWWMDQDDWPSQRDLKTFKKWFEVEFHSIVFDLVDKPICVVE